MTSVDGRRRRGDATRRTAARSAAMTATVGGLESVTVGGLAASTGLSKSGILTVFGSREAILLAAVAEARQIYIDTVIAPGWGAQPGRDRLRALVDSWFSCLRRRVFPGGCFITATSSEYGHREGPVADAIRKLKREWLDLIESELAVAGSLDPPGDAFRIDAFLSAANTRFQLFDDETALERGRHLALEVIDRHS
ncbi:TetR/AcrR family transcriptional regulator [Polymorphospora sp. A560]|uniref:Tetracyclin repressor-like C-terminal domain-containing protein n=2 Tax=Micromonosporaceae TaxID=28056 RepID=A0ABV5CL72_9ACTN